MSVYPCDCELHSQKTPEDDDSDFEQIEVTVKHLEQAGKMEWKLGCVVVNVR